jgi:hypothetical protein
MKAKIEATLWEVQEELESAMDKFDPFNTAHEGYAVILEEVDELWTEVKTQNPEWSKMRRECIQIAAMAIRFINDLGHLHDRVRK